MYKKETGRFAAKNISHNINVYVDNDSSKYNIYYLFLTAYNVPSPLLPKCILISNLKFDFLELFQMSLAIVTDSKMGILETALKTVKELFFSRYRFECNNLFSISGINSFWIFHSLFPFLFNVCRCRPFSVNMLFVQNIIIEVIIVVLLYSSTTTKSNEEKSRKETTQTAKKKKKIMK